MPRICGVSRRTTDAFNFLRPSPTRTTLCFPGRAIPLLTRVIFSFFASVFAMLCKLLNRLAAGARHLLGASQPGQAVNRCAYDIVGVARSQRFAQNVPDADD